jgi:hypothetical protein
MNPIAAQIRNDTFLIIYDARKLPTDSLGKPAERKDRSTAGAGFISI